MNRIIKLLSYVLVFNIILLSACGSGNVSDNKSLTSDDIAPQVSTRTSQIAKNVLGILQGYDSTLVTDSILKKTLNKVISKRVLEKTLGKHSGICPLGGTYTSTPKVVDSKTVVIEDRFTDCKSEVSLGETPLILVRNGAIKREYSDT